MEQKLCINIKKVEDSFNGCLVSGVVIVGSLSVGEDVLVYNYSEEVKLNCRGLIKHEKDSAQSWIVAKVGAGDEVTLIFSSARYNLLRNAVLVFDTSAKLYSKFVLSVKLSAEKLKDLARTLDTVYLQQVEFVALDQKLTGKAEVVDGKIVVEIIFRLWLQVGFEVVIWDKKTELARGNILEL